MIFVISIHPFRTHKMLSKITYIHKFYKGNKLPQRRFDVVGEAFKGGKKRRRTKRLGIYGRSFIYLSKQDFDDKHI